MELLSALGYELVSSLGSGLSGHVFRARKRSSGETFALKLSHPAPRHSAAAVAFKLEYYLHSHLDHPAIVRALHFGEVDEDRRYYTMEYVPARPLTDVYRRGGIRALGEVALRVTEALAYAHAQGILHGDVKPANILATLDAGGDPEIVRLADFGLSQRLATRSGSLVSGTIAYLAPEALVGGRVDGRADLYALGVTLFEAITGRVPRAGAHGALRPGGDADAGETRIESLAPDLEAGWATLVNELAARSPSSRPSSASIAAGRMRALLGKSARGARAPVPHPAPLGSALGIIGRERELARLGAILAVPDGVRTVLVTGEAGVGKTRLVEEFAESAALDGAGVHRSSARDGEAGVIIAAREAWREVRRVDLHAGGSGAGAAASRRWFVRGLRESDLETLAAEFLATVAPGRSPHDLVLVFDGLENADGDDLEFLSVLRRQVAERGGAMLVLAARSGAGADALRKALEARSAGEPAVEELRLQPLTAATLSALIVAVLGDPAERRRASVAPLSADDLAVLTEWIEAKTGGNPREAEIALAELVRLGHLCPGENGWSLDRGGLELEPPARSLRDEARELQERLGGELAPLLETAAVLGREFDVSLLSSLDESGGERTARFVAESFRPGILAAAPGGLSRLRFVNPELARAVYELVPEERRRGLHARAAALLTAADAGGASAAALAAHWEGAGKAQQAAEMYLRAARDEYRNGEYRQAARHFRKAWDQRGAGDPAGAPEFALDWIHALCLDGRYEEGSGVADEIRAAAPAANERFHCRLAILKGICLAFLGDHERAREALGPIVSGDVAAGDASLEAWARAEYGWLEVLAQRDRAAESHFLKARELAVVAGDARVKGISELRLGILEFRAHRPREALTWHARARDTYLAAGVDSHLPGVWANMALCQWNLLETRESIRHHRRAIEGYARQHRRGDVARGYSNLASALAESGRWSEAEEAIRAADRWNRGTYAPIEASYLEYARAQVLLYKGELADAARCMRRALDLARPTGVPTPIYTHLSLMARVHLRAGQLELAEQAAAESLSMATEHGDAWARAEALGTLAQLARERGDAALARERVDDAAAIAGEPYMPTVLFRIFLLDAELLSEHADPAARRRAAETLARGRDMIAGTDLRLWEGELELAAGRVALRAGEPAEASDALSRAYDLFADLGAEQLRAETLAALARSRGAQGNLSAARSAWRAAENLREHLALPSWPAMSLAGTGGEAPPAADRGESAAPSATAGEVASRQAVAALAPASRRRLLEAATAISRELVTLQDLDEVLAKILSVVVGYLGTERGVIALVDPASGQLRVELARNMDRSSIQEAIEISRTALDRAGAEQTLIFSGDALADPELGTHESIQRLRIRSLLATPLRWERELVGVLYVDHRELTDLFGPEELLFLQFIADMAVVGIRNARRLQRAEGKVRQLRGELEGTSFNYPETAARSALMQEIMERASLAARAGRIVLITGDNGVGKDHLARIIHHMSGQRGKFVECPLTSLAASLIESELFGIARMVATGVAARRGLVEDANEGTLFLNEIGDLTLDLQKKLLGLLDSGQFRRVGSEQVVRFRGLIVCATNADLERMVREQTFREDLYYRISGDVIRIPRLSDHAEDIPDLVEIFIRRFAGDAGGDPPVITPRARELLHGCPWDGNVRELRLCIRRAVDRAAGGVIDIEHLESPSLLRIRGRERMLPAELVSPAELEPDRIRRLRDALDRSGGIVRRAAVELGISNTTAWRWIERAGLEHLAIRRHGRNGD